MKPNNDKRREVAARLRGLAARSQGSLEFKRMGDVLATAQEITGTRGLSSVAHVLERYADLIEPEPDRTCRFVYDEEEREFKCDACGHLVTQHYSSREEYCVTELTAECFVHCPFCGAMVVGE